MFTTNPWKVYLTTIGIAASGYYLIILLRYYYRDLRNMLAGRRQLKSFVRNSDTTLSVQQSKEVDTVSTDQLAVQLREIIADAHQNKYSKEDLLLLLEMTLRDYSALSGTPFQTMINELIESECSKYGFIHLSVVELEQIWKQDV